MNAAKLLAIALLFTFYSASAQSIAKLKLSNKQSILNDKLFLNFPKDAVNSPRQADIMSADYNGNEETRIMLDIGDMRMVVFAREIHSFGSNNMVNDVTQWFNAGQYTGLSHKGLVKADSIEAILSTPSQFDESKSAILVNSLTVKTADNTVVAISAYINPEGFKKKDEFIALTEDIFKTLTKGTRKTNLKAHSIEHKIFGSDKTITINLPDSFAISIDAKYDFEVIHFTKYTALADTNWSNLTVYFGHHPSYFYPDYKFNKDEAEKLKGQFAGNKVEWLYFTNYDTNVFLKEQKIPADNIEPGMVAHVAMSSNKEAYIAKLNTIVEGITLKK